MKKDIQIGGDTYTVAPLTLDQGEEIFLGGGDAKPDPRAQNRKMVAACLNNAGGDYKAEQLGAMEYPIFRMLLDACLEINGFKTLVDAAVAKAATPGEHPAATVN